MKLFLGILSAFLALNLFLGADEPAAADALWKKADDAISALNKKPDKPPTSREEFVAYISRLITAADAAGKEFTDKFPHDPRRWKVRMFDAMTAAGRPKWGLPGHGEMEVILKEVLAAPDADAQVKGQASALTLLVATEKLNGGGGDSTAWMKKAEDHLKTYPDLGMPPETDLNSAIKSKLEGMKTLAELKSKPLDLKFKAVDGSEVDLSQMRGKVVLVDFWATWCGPCVGEVPNVVKTYEKLHPKGFEIVGISLDQDKSKLESFTRDKGMTWAQYFDGKGWKNEISSKFGIRSIPAMWLVDKKGMVVSTNARGELESLVEKQLAVE